MNFQRVLSALVLILGVTGGYGGRALSQDLSQSSNASSTGNATGQDSGNAG